MIQFWYWLVDFLPFEWAEPGKMIFMKNSLLAIIIITPLFGILSTMIVNNKMAFFSDALGHGAFTGLVIGSIAGNIEPIFAAIAFSVFFAVLVSVVKRKSFFSADTVIGVFSSISVALGIFIATYGGRSFSKLNSYLIGDLLSITPLEIFYAFSLLLLTILIWLFALNKMVVLSVSQSLAKSRQVNTILIETIFSVLIAVVVTLSIRWVGLLVINAMLVLPASISRNISRNMRNYSLFSVLTALICGIAGLLAAYYAGATAGATIVLFLGVLFFITFAVRKRFQ